MVALYKTELSYATLQRAGRDAGRARRGPGATRAGRDAGRARHGPGATRAGSDAGRERRGPLKRGQPPGETETRTPICRWP